MFSDAQYIFFNQFLQFFFWRKVAGIDLIQGTLENPKIERLEIDIL